jgi:hypothetical protein
MSRSHVLLHCPNAKLKAAREEAWEGKDPGGARVLLSNPPVGITDPQIPRALRHRKGRRGRVVEEGTDVEEVRAARLDGWIVWEAINTFFF